MQRGFQLGLLLLLVQLFQEGLGNLPAVTVAVLGFNVYLYVFPAAPLGKACVSLQHVISNNEWRRLFLSPLHHFDDWHLYFNMASFLWKGIHLERQLGGGWFLYLLSTFFLLTGLVYLLLQALIIKLIKRSDFLVEFIDLSSLSNECAFGFSGVLFALKVVSNHFNPGGVTYVLNIQVSNRIDSFVELVLIHLFAPGTSLVAHLAGVLVGLLYTIGPLKIIMETCAAYSGTGRGHGEGPPPAEDNRAEDTAVYSESYLAGLTEEEQIEMAIRISLKNQSKKGQTGQKETGLTPEEEEEEKKLEELRRNRQRRFEEGVTNEKRRRL